MYSNPTSIQQNIIIKNHHWKPINKIIDYLIYFCSSNNYSNIIEIGPGVTPFPIANHFVGFNESLTNYINIDIDIQKLPFDNNIFNFIYSRHTIEDIQNHQLKSKYTFPLYSFISIRSLHSLLCFSFSL